ncbi:hypothetical protein BN159_5457 [Streptomyces davaonensis JCM 4913]|uniref:Uncharacterized protein n=1 Tax=Streptomyces davaonensis (strain DSM 101723 / JCM 4913 / KCC S-0913 / 768) TaxID=1214101 RepID=K4R0Q6_STRDJ|nr:hypothetical protein [Streptomyces davaonensis]CCK29836.1 hypothetical protein BN159_5457 [Streptomyces davaonensis JCM 4913]
MSLITTGAVPAAAHGPAAPAVAEPHESAHPRAKAALATREAVPCR